MFIHFLVQAQDFSLSSGEKDPPSLVLVIEEGAHGCKHGLWATGGSFRAMVQKDHLTFGGYHYGIP